MQNLQTHPKSRRPVHQLEIERPDRMEEACGIFAVQALEQPVANLVYFKLSSIILALSLLASRWCFSFIILLTAR